MRMKYVGLEFQYFWKDASRQALSEYGHRMGKALEAYYTKMSFQEEEFVRTFENSLHSYDPHQPVYYNFSADAATASEDWTIQLRLTRISNLEGGIVNVTPKNSTPHRHIGRALIEQDVANVVTHIKSHSRSGFRRLLGQTLLVEYSGRGFWIYLFLKVEAIRTLLNWFRWQPLDGEASSFFEFAERVRSVLETSNQQQIIDLPFSDPEEVSLFAQRYDQRLKVQVPERDLQELFALLSLSPSEWFDAKVV